MLINWECVNIGQHLQPIVGNREVSVWLKKKNRNGSTILNKETNNLVGHFKIRVFFKLNWRKARVYMWRVRDMITRHNFSKNDCACLKYTTVYY